MVTGKYTKRNLDVTQVQKHGTHIEDRTHDSVGNLSTETRWLTIAPHRSFQIKQVVPAMKVIISNESMAYVYQQPMATGCKETVKMLVKSY